MKFSEYWAAIIRLYEADGIDIDSMNASYVDGLKEDYRAMWFDEVEPEEAYDRIA